MNEVFNFSAGPAMLPKEVMQQAQAELLNWQQQGCSVMEMSHRSKAFIQVAETAEQDLRQLLAIPDNYKVLFMHGGGRGQFSAVPLNLSTEGQSADYLVTGSWSKGAVKEAKNYLNTSVVAENIQHNGQWRPAPITDWQLNSEAAFFHYCPNETVDGIELTQVPDTGDVPVVADMSSCILSKKINVKDYGLIYAGAQKNIGPSGLTLVIIRDDLLGLARQQTPCILNYQLQADNGSMYNTPPTFAWYLSGLVFKWLKQQGGVEAIEEVNQQKSALLYDVIDNSDFYHSQVAENYRSRMNVPFQLHKPELDGLFLQQAEACGLKALKGHRSVGGMRASIYNAMPLSGVQALVEFMHKFAKENR